MKIINKIKKPMYNEETLVDYYTIYVVDHLPREEEYIEQVTKKGML